MIKFLAGQGFLGVWFFLGIGKLIVKAFENALFDREKKTYPESDKWKKAKTIAWNFNDLLRLIIKVVVSLALLAILIFFLWNLFSGSIGLDNLLS